MTADDVRKAIRAGAVRPQKSLGQNFLIDGGFSRRIVDAADIRSDDAVAEIGSGLCALTRLLCERAGFVTAVEIDRFLVPKILEQMRGAPNFRLIHADALKTPAIELIPVGEDAAARARFSAFKLVSNLPYASSVKILSHVLNWNPKPDLIVVMTQKEVADRLLAAPGSSQYGALSVMASYGYVARRAFFVPPHCFVPQPGVESVVVVLTAIDSPPFPVADKDVFFAVVRAAFAQRRKTLENCLLSSCLTSFSPDAAPRDGRPRKENKGAARERARAVFESSGVSPTARGETLSFEKFAAVANAVTRAVNKY